MEVSPEVERRACPLCGGATPKADLAEAGWLAPDAASAVRRGHPNWRREDGACPACVQRVLLEMLLEQGEEALHAGVSISGRLGHRAIPTTSRGGTPTAGRCTCAPGARSTG